MRGSRRRFRWHGFTLVEFLVALLLVAIMTAMASAGMQRLRARMNMNTSVNRLLHAIHEARSRALVSGNEVVICPSGSGSRCDAGRTWQAGWLVFQTAVPGQQQPGHANSTLLAGDGMAGLTVTANRRAFVLRPFGRRSSNGTLIFCDRDALTQPRALVISYTGKPRVSRTTASGRPLNCRNG